MATTEAPPASEVPPSTALPSNQENQDPDAPGALRDMFMDGINKIGTHKTENLFEALEKRNLTDAEQAVINERVAHQRKMFELFERRERQRKIQELREVCPDITEAEAEAALDMCNGKEDDAASALISDTAFRRKVRIYCGISPPPAVIRQSNIRSRPSKPAGPRPKLIDPATLGSNVFVGAFRGKGFQGASKSTSNQKPNTTHQQGSRNTKGTTARSTVPNGNLSSRPSSEAEETEDELVNNNNSTTESENIEQEEPGQDGSKGEGEEGGEEDVACEAQPGDPMDSDDDPKQENDSGSGAKVEEHTEEPGEDQRGQLDKDAVKSTTAYNNNDSKHQRTPLSVPKTYALVRETSQGEVRPVTESELKKVSAPSSHGRRKRSSNAVKSMVVDDDDEIDDVTTDFPIPTGTSRRPRAISTATLENMVIKLSEMEDDAGAAWLSAMNPEVAGNVLQTLGSEDPMRAITLQEMLEAHRSAATAVAAAENTKTAIVANNSKGRTEEEENNNNNNNDAQDDLPELKSNACDSEATMSEDMKGDKKGAEEDDVKCQAELVPSSTGRPQRTSARRKSYSEMENPVKLPSPVANKRRKSSPMDQTAVVKMASDVDEAKDDVKVVDTDKKASGHHQHAAKTTMVNNHNTSSNKSTSISARGHTNRGRVKQKSHKSADLVDVGALQLGSGWHNAGYIFPAGFHSRTLFRSSVALDQLCVHECYIIGKGGEYWPAPTYKVVALDRPEEPLIAKSCTGCWTGVLKRINAEIEARRKAGEDLPPPPKTAIAGPEYFGLNQPNIQEAIEELDPDHKCIQYWAGKEERQKAAASLPLTVHNNAGGGGAGDAAGSGGARVPKPPRAPRAPTGGGSSRRGGGRRRRGGDSDSEAHDGVHGSDVEDETQYMTNRWSAVSRTDRYRKRLEDNGEDASALGIDADNPVPEIIDPITLEPVVRPAISPYGHVMGAATWKAVLAENGKCPFTKQPLRWEQCKMLTPHNIEYYRDKIIK